MSETRDRWLIAGVDALVDEGVAGVRIDRLAARLGLSKGSFHHHFAGANGFKQDLLDHIEHVLIDSLHEATKIGDGGEHPQATFARLIDMVAASSGDLYRPRLEIALRAWALTDSEAARTQATIDHARVEVLRRVWRRFDDDRQDERIAALLPYVVALGATVIIPPLSTGDLRQLFELIFPLVPSDDMGHQTPGSGIV